MITEFAWGSCHVDLAFPDIPRGDGASEEKRMHVAIKACLPIIQKWVSNRPVCTLGPREGEPLVFSSIEDHRKAAHLAAHAAARGWGFDRNWRSILSHHVYLELCRWRYVCDGCTDVFPVGAGVSVHNPGCCSQPDCRLELVAHDVVESDAFREAFEASRRYQEWKMATPDRYDPPAAQEMDKKRFSVEASKSLLLFHSIASGLKGIEKATAEAWVT